MGSKRVHDTQGFVVEADVRWKVVKTVRRCTIHYIRLSDHTNKAGMTYHKYDTVRYILCEFDLLYNITTSYFRPID